MNIIEFMIWALITLILMKLNEKPIYDYLLDFKYRYIYKYEEPIYVNLTEK